MTQALQLALSFGPILAALYFLDPWELVRSQPTDKETKP